VAVGACVWMREKNNERIILVFQCKLWCQVIEVKSPSAGNIHKIQVPIPNLKEPENLKKVKTSLVVPERDHPRSVQDPIRLQRPIPSDSLINTVFNMDYPIFTELLNMLQSRLEELMKDCSVVDGTITGGFHDQAEGFETSQIS
jgi:hypothetical protein